MREFNPKPKLITVNFSETKTTLKLYLVLDTSTETESKLV